MSGIEAIDIVRNYYSTIGTSYGKRKLTPGTRSKLIALGVDTSNIKTEAEGLIKLREAEEEKSYGGKEKTNTKETAYEKNLKNAKALAQKLNISVSDTYTVDDIVNKIKEKINEMKVQAGKDFDKLANIGYYEQELTNVEDTQYSSLKLTSSLDLTANMNMAYHGIY